MEFLTRGYNIGLIVSSKGLFLFIQSHVAWGLQKFGIILEFKLSTENHFQTNKYDF